MDAPSATRVGAGAARAVTKEARAAASIDRATVAVAWASAARRLRLTLERAGLRRMVVVNVRLDREQRSGRSAFGGRYCGKHAFIACATRRESAARRGAGAAARSRCGSGGALGGHARPLRARQGERPQAGALLLGSAPAHLRGGPRAPSRRAAGRRRADR